MRGHSFVLPDIAFGGFERVSLCLIIPHYHIQMQMDTEPGGQNVSEPTDLDSKTSYYSYNVCTQEDVKNKKVTTSDRYVTMKNLNLRLC